MQRSHGQITASLYQIVTSMSTPNDLWNLWDLRGAWGTLKGIIDFGYDHAAADGSRLRAHSVGEAGSEASLAAGMIELAKPPF